MATILIGRFVSSAPRGTLAERMRTAWKDVVNLCFSIVADSHEGGVC